MDEAILEFLKFMGNKDGNFSPSDSQLFNNFIIKKLKIDEVFRDLLEFSNLFYLINAIAKRN